MSTKPRPPGIAAHCGGAASCTLRRAALATMALARVPNNLTPPKKLSAHSLMISSLHLGKSILRNKYFSPFTYTTPFLPSIMQMPIDEFFSYVSM